MQRHAPSRRQLLKGGAAAAALAAAPSVRARAGRLRSEPLRIAAIGAANRGAANVSGVLGAGARIVALADVDAGHLAAGAGQVAADGGAAPALFADWRRLLDAHEGALDGVVVSTADHTHFAVARAALARALPVYVEKPLAHTVAETRELRRLAAEAGVPTQMGTQIHATENYRRVVEAIRAGVIGDVQRVDIVCNKSWSDGRFGAPAEPPAQLDWDLWLGPAAARPYSSGVHPAHWRRFWDFGTGTVGDMACHWLDLVHWALELGAPTRVEVDGPEPDPVGTPPWMVARWTYARAGGGAPVEVAWFDGGKRPEDVELDHCHVWRGTRGRLVSTYGSLEVILDDPDEVWTPPEPTLAASPGHYVEWLDAIRDEAPGRPLCGFEYAAPLTEAVLLSTVAFRAGEAIDWDAEKGVGSAGEEFLSTPERDGWNV